MTNPLTGRLYHLVNQNFQDEDRPPRVIPTKLKERKPYYVAMLKNSGRMYFTDDKSDPEILIGTNGPDDYITDINDINNSCYGGTPSNPCRDSSHHHGVFRVIARYNPNHLVDEYLVYNGGDFDGKKLILDSRGRVLRYPKIIPNVSLAVMNPVLDRNGVPVLDRNGVPKVIDTSPTGSRLLDFLATNPNNLKIFTEDLGFSIEDAAQAAMQSSAAAAATATPVAAEPKMGGKRLKKSKRFNKKKLRRSRRHSY